MPFSSAAYRPLPPQYFAIFVVFSIIYSHVFMGTHHVIILYYIIWPNICPGHLFGITQDCVIIAAGLNGKSIFSTYVDKRLTSYASKLFWADGTLSDCLAILQAYKVYVTKRKQYTRDRPDLIRYLPIWVQGRISARGGGGFLGKKYYRRNNKIGGTKNARSVQKIFAPLSWAVFAPSPRSGRLVLPYEAAPVSDHYQLSGSRMDIRSIPMS